MLYITNALSNICSISILTDHTTCLDCSDHSLVNRPWKYRFKWTSNFLLEGAADLLKHCHHCKSVTCVVDGWWNPVESYNYIQWLSCCTDITTFLYFICFIFNVTLQFNVSFNDKSKMGQMTALEGHYLWPHSWWLAWSWYGKKKKTSINEEHDSVNLVL